MSFALIYPATREGEETKVWKKEVIVEPKRAPSSLPVIPSLNWRTVY